MYCWTYALTMPEPENDKDSEHRILYSGTDEEEAVAIAKRSVPYYAKVVTKTLGGNCIFHAIHPDIRAAMKKTRQELP
jgi:bisphosphoglycerate-dependent phosphoglycerate mutase